MNPDGLSRLSWMDQLLSTPNDDEHGGIDGYARAVAFVLFRHMDASGFARPGTRTIAKQAGVAHNVAENRIRVLEEAGWLAVERRPGATNRYRATMPTAPADGAVTAPRDGAVTAPGAPPDGAPDSATAPSEAKTAPPRGHEPENQRTTSPTQTTHARPKRHWEPRTEPRYEKGQKVTRPLLWRMMAWRRLELDRQIGRDNLPPPGSYREVRLLETLEADFETQFDAKALDLVGKLPPNDLERWIYQLAPELAKHGWGPVLAAGNAQHARWKAESDARMAKVTAEEHEQITLGLRELKESIRSGRHLTVVESEAS